MVMIQKPVFSRDTAIVIFFFLTHNSNDTVMNEIQNFEVEEQFLGFSPVNFVDSSELPHSFRLVCSAMARLPLFFPQPPPPLLFSSCFFPLSLPVLFPEPRSLC